jgi:pilus assembly protein FimV
MSFDELVLPEEFEHNPAVAEAPAAPTFDAPPPAFEPAPVLEAGDDFDFLSDTDEIATKLDLARAYIDMGDTDGARDILDEVLQEGSDVQKQEASSLISRIG